ncbi:hypothetical protein ACPOL_1078 [Acidisarcina polymorpha]|uniref:DUF2071 domain-containing protein n=2 Tax=Acidisarcina polymorpha TaxID=2211140 RepID=A0A2Z5FU92_9BACT|nr:hypothetical protein ACPOL_1078 [Acidisarcina polymorpha]
MTQRWNDLLFAHWPLPATQISRLLPEGLAVDTFDGSAWVGVVPFWMDRVQIRGMPLVPGANRFPELNLRTYVREADTNVAGVYFFSLDAANPAAVAAARLFFHLPYYWAKMSIQHQGKDEFHYSSERRLSRRPVRFQAQYRGLGRMSNLDQSRPGTIEHFLTERYALYTTGARGQLLRGNIHHLPWPLELAEAEFHTNELPAAHGIELPDTAPLLHYARELVVYVWSLDLAPSLLKHPSVAAVPEPL